MQLIFIHFLESHSYDRISINLVFSRMDVIVYFVLNVTSRHLACHRNSWSRSQTRYVALLMRGRRFPYKRNRGTRSCSKYDCDFIWYKIITSWSDVSGSGVSTGEMTKSSIRCITDLEILWFNSREQFELDPSWHENCWYESFSFSYFLCNFTNRVDIFGTFIFKMKSLIIHYHKTRRS